MLKAENSSLVAKVVLNVHCVNCRVDLLRSIRPISSVFIILNLFYPQNLTRWEAWSARYVLELVSSQFLGTLSLQRVETNMMLKFWHVGWIQSFILFSLIVLTSPWKDKCFMGEWDHFLGFLCIVGS